MKRLGVTGGTCVDEGIRVGAWVVNDIWDNLAEKKQRKGEFRQEEAGKDNR